MNSKNGAQHHATVMADLAFAAQFWQGKNIYLSKIPEFGLKNPLDPYTGLTISQVYTVSWMK